MDTVTKIVSVLFIILLNAFFVASEIALLTVKKRQFLKFYKENNPLNKFVIYALDNIDYFLGTTQLGVTISGVALGWMGEPFIAASLYDLIKITPLNTVSWLIHPVSFFLSFVLIIYFEIVIGELVPKQIALHKSELTFYSVIMPLYLFARIFRPFIKILHQSAKFILKLIKITPDLDDEPHYSQEEIEEILEKLVTDGLLRKNEEKIVGNALRLKDIPISKLLMPKPDMKVIPHSIKLEDIFSLIKSHNYSRYPVYEKTQDNIKGFVHVKDIYKAILESGMEKKLSELDLIRKIIYTPETKKAYDVLIDMQRKHVHMAVVINEFGSTTGIVTLEDIIESMVGDIQDEFDKSLDTIKRQADGSYIVNGKTTSEILKKRFLISFDNNQYNTAGGFIMGLLGREPIKGDRIKYGNLIFEVIDIKGRRINYFKITRNQEA